MIFFFFFGSGGLFSSHPPLSRFFAIQIDTRECDGGEKLSRHDCKYYLYVCVDSLLWVCTRHYVGWPRVRPPVPPAAPGTFQTWPLLIDTAHVETRNTQHRRADPAHPFARHLELSAHCAIRRPSALDRQHTSPGPVMRLYLRTEKRRKGETENICTPFDECWRCGRERRRRGLTWAAIHGARTAAECRQRTDPGLILAFIIYQSIII